MRIKRRLTKFFLHLFYRKLWAQITPIILVTVTIPVLFLGFLLINTSQQAMRDSIAADHEEIATIAAEEIALFVRRAQDILQTTGAMLSAVYPAPWKQETTLVELVLDQPVFIRVVSVDLKGRPLASSELGRGMAWQYPQEILPGALSEKIYISEIKMLDNHTPYVTMAAPIRKMGRVVGALIADVNFRGIWDVVDNIKLGRTGRAFLVSQDAILIAHHDKKLVLKRMNLSDQGDVLSVLAGKTGMTEMKDASGKKIISSYASVQGVHWGIVLRQDQEEAFLFSKIMKTQSWVIIIISEILAILASITIARFLTRPVKTLASEIRSVANGNLEHKVELKKRDEIGELIRSFNDMAKKLKQAQEKMRLSAIGEAAAWISHELKNSLMLLKSFVYLFPEEHADEKFADRFGRLVPSEVSRWERMLNELSGLSTPHELKIARVDIQVLLADTLEMMSEKLKEKNINVYYLQQSRPLYIMADQERLKQVFINLIINAAHAMSDGGSLSVLADGAPAADTSKPKFIEVRIKDTGRGIPVEALGKIFDPFYSIQCHGEGLGLTITRKIIEQHGGSIRAESRVDAGATFIITLPEEISLGSVMAP